MAPQGKPAVEPAQNLAVERDRTQALTFVEQKIDVWYKDQPGWLRGMAFSLFLLLFTYAFLRLFSSQYTVRGLLKEKVDEVRTQAARGYEVRLSADNESFGANFRGFYYAVVGPLQYASLMISGKTKIVVRTDANQEFPEREVRFDRVYGSFEQVVLDPATTASMATPMPGRGGGMPSLLPVVYAGETQTARTKVVLYESTIKADVQQAIEGEFTFVVNGRTYPFLAAGGNNQAAGTIPLGSGDTFQYGNDYYVRVPRTGASFLTGTINLGIDNGLSLGPVRLSGYTEAFPVKIEATAYGKQAIYGAKGSRVTLIVCQPYAISIFEKRDIKAIAPRLQGALAERGFCPVPKVPPLGVDSQTNAVYLNKDFPFDKAQQLLRAFVSAGVRLKHIEANLPLPNNDDAQLGGFSLCNDSGVLAEEDLQKVLSATSKEVFQSAIMNLPACDAAPRTSAAPRTASPKRPAAQR